MSAHGTRTHYIAGCRCFVCRLANGAYENARTAARIERESWRVRYVRCSQEWLVQHQLTGETEYRGPSQVEAYERRDALNALARGESEAEPLWADEAQERAVRRHLERLQVTGVGLKQVSRLTGISRNRLSEIRRQAPRRLKHATAERIQAVPISPRLAAPGASVDARETWRLIGELLAAGLRRREIARALGSAGKEPSLQLQPERVRKATADAVRALHDTAYRGSARLRAVCQCPEWRTR